MNESGQVLSFDSSELTCAFGSGRLVPLRHPNQRNMTWLFQPDHEDHAIFIKRYSWSGPDRVTNVLEAEACARAANVPVPPAIWRSVDGLSVAYEYFGGTPGVPDNRRYVQEAATLFVRQLRGLENFVPKLAPVRPVHLPRRALVAVSHHPHSQVSRTIIDAWHWLGQKTWGAAATASHVDWRADNILCSPRGVSAVLDWEDTVCLPPAEAVGYAAGSLTHSWRDGLYRPVTLDSVTQFLTAAGDRLGWQPGSGDMEHACVAALFTAGVRLAEDQRRNRAAVSLSDIRSAIEGI